MNKSVLIDLGTVAATGAPFTADIVTILRSNLLVQAASGGRSPLQPRYLHWRPEDARHGEP